MSGASNQSGEYPRPQLVRERYSLLDGPCGFAFDDDDAGVAERWSARQDVFSQTITLPFSPESPASGIGETGFHRVVWYRKTFDSTDLDAAGLGVQGSRIILHLGAIDRVAQVWVDGVFVARNAIGQTAWSVEITHAIAGDTDEHAIVIRAEDDPLDTVAPRGKQDWHEHPHSIWYHRATGVWRSLWLEAVPEVYIAQVAWTPDVANARVRAEVELSVRPTSTLTVSVAAWFGDRSLVGMTVDTDSARVVIDVPIAALRNGQAIEELLWSPSEPRLIDARVTLESPVQPVDAIESYFGLRTVAVAGGRLRLNDRPFYLRSVLQQGYWPQSHYTPPSVAAMRDEIELVKRLGFNSIRIHQKVEDPRYLYWCDRLGLAVWAESAAAYEFSPRAVDEFVAEWTSIVRSQHSHPSILVWVPFNESWGIQHVAHDPAQRAYSLALTQLTRALDPTRPVISNDGWEHTNSDILSIHDYEASAEVLRERYGNAEALNALVAGVGPAGRRINLGPESQAPIMLTEFGGISFDPAGHSQESWGYSSARSAAQFQAHLGAVFAAVHDSQLLAGFCYTQLTDTGQETNGLCTEDRVPKLPEEVIRAMVVGSIQGGLVAAELAPEA